MMLADLIKLTDLTPMMDPMDEDLDLEDLLDDLLEDQPMKEEIQISTGRGTPKERGERQAEACFPPAFRIKKRKMVVLLRKKIAAHVKLPRAEASMRIKFKLDVVPLDFIQQICEEAGLTLKAGITRRGGKNVRVWTTAGPAATARFAQLDEAHPLGWGGAKLTAPGKNATKKVCRVMTLLAPPLQVTHELSSDVECATITANLVTYNEQGRLGLPPHPHRIWGDATQATESALKKYAKKMLGNMFLEGLPVSQTFKQNLGWQYAGSESEMSDVD